MGIELRVAQQVKSFLGDGERALRLAQDLVATPESAEQRNILLARFARRVLMEAPHISMLLAADAQGNYLGVRRGPEGGTAQLEIRNDPGPRRLTRTHKDATGQEIASEEVVETGFDPRTRPWYRAAMKSPSEAWTELYVFFNDRAPGITVSAAMRPVPGEPPVGVVALDVSLDALSGMLAGLHIGRTGRAVLIDRAGQIVAHPDPRLTLRETPEGLATERLDAIGDPVLARALDHVRLSGDFRAVEEVDGARHFIVATSLHGAGAEGWRLIIAVPEQDFTGFVRLNSRRALLMSLGVVAVATLLALFLVRQGLRADAAAVRLIEDRACIAAQSDAFAQLADSAALFDPGAKLPPELTERLCVVARAARAAVWRLTPDGRALTLEDAYEAEGGGHLQDALLPREEMPALFARLATGETIRTSDAARERATAELHRAWLQPLGTRGLIAVPIRHGARSLGLAWVEDPRASDDEVLAFLKPVAKLLSVRLAGGAAHLAARAASVKAQAPAAAPLAEARLGAGVLDPAGHADLAADVHPLTAVAVIRFTEARALAERGGKGAGPLIERLAGALEAAAREAGIPYLRLLGEEMVAAVGLAAEESGTPAARRIATFALAARGACLHIFEQAETEPTFSIGLDLGVAIGSRVGSAAPFLNLWGEAVRAARELAASAPVGGIQASDSVYAALADAFLFRPRGRFHVPGRGVASSFILAAEL